MNDMKNKKTIYFLCTGNSCRSQIAEGFAKKYLGEKYKILSAGIEPRGIHPLAIKVMNEVGIDISNQTSDVVNLRLLNQVDIVITLCKDAKERCPVVVPRSAHFHWPFDDPASVRGTEDEVLAEFRRVRDEIEATILKFVKGETGEVFRSAPNSIEDLTRKEDFGQRIKTIREAKGLSIKGLADKIQVSEDYLSKTEKNQTEPSKYFIHTLGTVCDLEYDALVEYLYYVKK